MTSMSEDSQGEKPKKISRRFFLKRAAKAATGAVLGGFVLREADHRERGVHTAYGRVKMLYERHGDPLNIKDIPEDTQYFFREEVLPAFANDSVWNRLKADTAQLDVIDILLAGAVSYPGSTREKYTQTFPENLTKHLEEKRIPLILGDVDVGTFRTQDYLQQTAYVRTLAALGALISGVGLGKLAENRVLKSTGDADKAWDRREFVKVTGVLLAAGIFSHELGAVINALSASKGEKMPPALETFVRLTTDLHPENVGLFFRNAVMALKILMAGKESQETTGKEPLGAALVEQIHAGIEDFLVLGEDLLRVIIAATPKSILREVVKASGGIEQIASAVVIDLSSGKSDLHTRVLTDEKLVSLLRESLSVTPKRE